MLAREERRGGSASFDRRTAWSWAIAAALLLGNLLLHKPISDVCDALYARIGRAPYERWTLLAIAALSLAGAALLLRRRGAALRRPRVVACLLALAVLTVAAQRWLLVSNVELIHLPQFGLLAALLLLAGLGPQTAWIAATLGGVLDEGYQYLVIYAHLSTVSFDYNDIVLNAVGAAWAVVLGAAGGASPRELAPGSRRVAGALALAALAVSGFLSPPRLQARVTFPFWQPTLVRAATGFDYHVMAPSEGLAALLLLWGLVWIATRGERRREATGAAVATALLCLGLCCWGCSSRTVPARREGDRSAAPLSVDAARADARAGGLAAAARMPFIVTFWCGPPPAELTDARAAEIAAAGFTVVGAPCEGAVTPGLNRRALDVAARHGLSMWISDGRVGQYYGLAPQWETRLAEAVAEYGDHPALGGYFLIDEPGAEQFADLGKAVAGLRAADPRRLPYVNILPDFAPAELLGTDTYREHLERYMTTVRPTLLSYDYYPFRNDSDRASFFDNLALVRAAAQTHGVPFMLIVQAMPHGPYRDPTEAEMAWQVNHALAFGARGISYFAYWTPVNVDGAEHWRFRHGLIENGRRTEHFDQAARINATTRAIAAQLDDWQSIAVVDSQGRFGVRLPLGPFAGIEDGPVTAGLFDDGAGGLSALLVNQDYRAPTTVRLALRAGAALPEAFDPAMRQWQPLADATVVLPPAAPLLLRWP
jgi:hypothetical protein